MSKAELDAFVVLGSDFEAVDNFKHQKEGRRRTVSFFVFVLSKLPISHNVPYYLALIDRSFLQFFVFKVDNFKKTEHLRPDPLMIDTEFSDDSFLDICKCIVRLNSYEYAVSYRQIDRN